MAFVDWKWQGIQISNCNCNVGCPCQFNALPSHGDCRAYMFGRIDKGYFGQTKLDGLHFGGLFAWPGAIHMGNGEAMPVIDERADKDQRAAIESILMGKETEPGCFGVDQSSREAVLGGGTQLRDGIGATGCDGHDEGPPSRPEHRRAVVNGGPHRRNK